MVAHTPSPTVSVEQDGIVVRGRSAYDNSPFDETILFSDLTKIVLERFDAGARGYLTHWFLVHRDGWTLHFNDGCVGADAVISWLIAFAKFTLPPPEELAQAGGEGTLVWTRNDASTTPNRRDDNRNI